MIPGSPSRARPWGETRADLLAALLTGIGALVVYLLTLTPTTAFWDAGEFIATSYTLGIPHPPGTPLYGILGRVFTLLPLPLSIAERVNLLSALPSALAVLGTVQVTIRLLARCGPPFGEPEAWPPRATAIARIGGVLAGGVMAGSSTFWTNAIEAEVYALSSLVMVVTLALMLRWQELRHLEGEGARGASNLVVVVVYLLGLSIGFHMGTFVVLLPLVLFFLADRARSLTEPTFLASAVLLVLLFFVQGFSGVQLQATLAIVFALLLLNGRALGWRHVIGVGTWGVAVLLGVVLLRETELPVGIVVGIIAAVVLLAFTVERRRLVHRNLGFWVPLLLAVGLSVHAFLFIRAGLDPPINEADPSTIERLWLAVSRDQYKPGPPWELRGGFDTDLVREGVQVRDAGGEVVPLGERIRAELETKLDVHLWRYWRVQYPIGPGVLLLLPFVLGAMGGVVHAARARRSFLLMAFLLLASSVGLAWHLNFRPDEVRDRDYFFVALFQFFTVWIGMGGAAVLHLVREAAPRPEARRVLIPAVGGVLLLAPLGQLRSGWFEHDRSDFYIARDYGENLLAPLPENAILFTNGDNDTFPLWYLQLVEGVRPDVRVANLSLLNTTWYLKEIRDHEPRVPISWDDATIDQLRPYWDEERRRPVYLKDLAVFEILEQNRWERPLYLATTVPDRMGLDDARMLRMEGLSYRIVRGPVDERVDAEALARNLDRFRWRGLLDENGELDDSLHRDETTTRLSQNYASAYIELGRAFLARARDAMDAGDDARFEAWAHQAIPALERARTLRDGRFTSSEIDLGLLYHLTGLEARAETLYTRLIQRVGELGETVDPGYRRYLPELTMRRAEVRYDRGRYEAALADYGALLEVYPQEWMGWEGTIEALRALGRDEEAREALETWRGAHPDHEGARRLAESFDDPRADGEGRNP